MAIDAFLNFSPVPLTETTDAAQTTMPSPGSSQPSATAPSPQDLQANIDQAIQQAAQNLGQILKAAGTGQASSGTPSPWDVATNKPK